MEDNAQKVRLLEACINDLVSLQALPPYDAQGAIYAIAGVSTDITERKQAEIEMLELKDALATDLIAMTSLHEFGTRLSASTELQPILEELLDAIIRLHHADFGNIQLYNPQTRSLKIVAQRGLQQDFLDYFNNVHVDSADCGRALQRRERVVIEDVETDPGFEPHRPIAASSGFRALQSTPLFSHNGRLLGMISTHFRHPHSPSERQLRSTDLYARQAADMMERKQAEDALKNSEERFRLLADGIKDYAVFMLDPDGMVMKWNSGAERIKGYRPEEIIGQSIARFYEPSDIQLNKPEQVLKMAAATGRCEEEGWRVRKDGTRFWANVVTTALRDETEELQEFVNVTRDMTESHEGRVALERAYQEVKELKDKLALETRYMENEIRSEQGFEEIIGQSQPLRSVLRLVEKVASTTTTVLIQGETGTGKELIARAIHNRSKRCEKTFVKLNCAAIPTGLLESELFGHEKGAFTGAVIQKLGRFELGHQGTIFLDEVGEIPLELQVKLLRVLQEQEFERLGSIRTQHVDVRVLAATNRDLAQMVTDKQFRSDLYYRFNVFPIHIPPLRERGEDIPPLVYFFMNKYSRQFNKPLLRISDATMNVLCRYAWPGNIRELENIVKRCIILSSGEILELDGSWLELRSDPMAPLHATTLEDAERDHIYRMLMDCHWIIGGASGAATKLGMKRTSLQYKMQKLGITRPQGKPAFHE